MVLSREQNAERSRNVMIYNSPFESLEEFKYLGITVTDQNFIQEKLRAD